MKGMTNAQKDISDLATQSALNTTNAEVAKKANQTALDALQTTVAGKQDKLTAGTNITISGNTISASGGTITAGEGISVSGTKVSLESIGSSKSAGSGTSVPVVSIDAYGRVTSLSSTTIYPPTTAGEAGQVWMSDGSGVGYWATISTVSPITEVKVAATGRLLNNYNTSVIVAFTAMWNADSSILGPRTATLTVDCSYKGNGSSTVFTAHGTASLTNADILKGSFVGYLDGSEIYTSTKDLSYSSSDNLVSAIVIQASIVLN